MIRYFRSWFAILRGILAQYAEAEYSRLHDPLAIARAKVVNRWLRWWLIPSGVLFVISFGSIVLLTLAGTGFVGQILAFEGLFLMVASVGWFLGYSVITTLNVQRVKRVKKAYREEYREVLHQAAEDAREDRT